MDKESRSSLDEFLCIGHTKEKLSQALVLAIGNAHVMAWREFEGSIHIYLGFQELSKSEWAEFPPKIDPSLLASIFWPQLISLPSLYPGDGKRGWRVLSTTDTVIIQPWTLHYAK